MVLGTQQELKAKASVDALSKLQTPRARVRRDGVLAETPATDLVPGDIVSLEAGDLVPAVGLLRGQPFASVILLGISIASRVRSSR